MYIVNKFCVNYVIVFLINCISITAMAQTKLKVFLMAGQSNMVGNSDNNVLPAELKVNQNNIKINVFGTANFDWGPLRPGLGSIPAAHGSEVSFGYNMAKYMPNDSIAIIKGAWSGTDLATRWRPPSSGGTVGDLYTQFVAKTHAAIAALGSGYQVEIAGMCWMQGESDAMNLTSANAYQTNLTNFIHDIRAEFNVPDMPFSIGKIMSDATYQYYSIVRQAEDNVVAAGTKISDFETSDLTISGGHYVLDGCRVLGERFATNMLMMYNIFPPQNNTPVWNFNTNNYSEGWTLTQSLNGTVTGGNYNLTVTAADPYMHSPSSLGVDASMYKYFVVRMKNTTSDNKAEFFWITTTDGAYDGNKRIIFDVKPNDTDYSTYIIDLSKNTYWKGTVKQLRLDPSWNAVSGSISIDYLKLMGAPYPDQQPIMIPGIIEMENYNLGGEGIAYHDADTKNNGNEYRTDGVDIQKTSDSGGGYNIGWLSNGEWLEYLVNVATAGNYTMDIRVASGMDNNKFHIETDGIDQTSVITVNNTGGVQTWGTVNKTIVLNAGLHIMKVYIDNSAGGFNLNKISVSNTTGIHDEKKVSAFVIYPNPAKDRITINHEQLSEKSFESGENEILILDLQGRIIKSFSLSHSVSDLLDLSELENGIYFLRTKNELKKIIINK